MTSLFVTFKNLAIENPVKSLEAGRPIFDDIEHCVIRSGGSQDVKCFPARSFSRWVGDQYGGGQVKQTYAERFSHQYQQFKAQWRRPRAARRSNTRRSCPRRVAPN